MSTVLIHSSFIIWQVMINESKKADPPFSNIILSPIQILRMNMSDLLLLSSLLSTLIRIILISDLLQKLVFNIFIIYFNKIILISALLQKKFFFLTSIFHGCNVMGGWSLLPLSGKFEYLKSDYEPFFNNNQFDLAQESKILNVQDSDRLWKN